MRKANYICSEMLCDMAFHAHPASEMLFRKFEVVKSIDAGQYPSRFSDATRCPPLIRPIKWEQSKWDEAPRSFGWWALLPVLTAKLSSIEIEESVKY